jgi:hypothetical protein
MSDKNKHLKTGLMETVNLLVNFPNVEKTKYTRQGGIFVSKINNARNVDGNAFMCKY